MSEERSTHSNPEEPIATCQIRLSRKCDTSDTYGKQWYCLDSTAERIWPALPVSGGDAFPLPSVFDRDCLGEQQETVVDCTFG